MNHAVRRFQQVLFSNTRVRFFATTIETGEAPMDDDALADLADQNRASSIELEPLKDLKPSQLVKELDKYIIGQQHAKRAVAVALRNRWRRFHLPTELRDEVTPKNILLIGPTGCGKTEIARRLAKLTDAPFLKVEATKFTEVGFHGRDVDQIIRDLVRVAINQKKTQRKAQLKDKIELEVENRILEALVGPDKSTKESMRVFLRNGQLNDNEVEIDVPVKENDMSERGMLKQVMTFVNPNAQKRTEKKRVKISEAKGLLFDAISDQFVSTEDITRAAIKSVENHGIVFIDEIDKIASSAEKVYHGADASAEGVQRDLLPLIEGCTVDTKQGPVNTDHILFIASGAFHSVKPSDLLAELQGRLPIRVELKALTEDDLYRILTETESSLIKQQVELLKTEGAKLTFTDAAVREIAKVASECNRSVENIGARRLATIIERITEDISFSAPDTPGLEVTIDEKMVREKVGDLLLKTDLARFML